MAIRKLITRGFGNGTYLGTPNLVTIRGMIPGPPLPPDAYKKPLLGGVNKRLTHKITVKRFDYWADTF